MADTFRGTVKDVAPIELLTAGRFATVASALSPTQVPDFGWDDVAGGAGGVAAITAFLLTCGWLVDTTRAVRLRRTRSRP